VPDEREGTMADLTIRIPSAHAGAVRASLEHVRAGLAEALSVASAGELEMRGILVELRDAEAALAQLAPGREEAAVSLSAHPELLSDVLHGALADAIEAFEAACEADWRGASPEPPAGVVLQRLLALFTLFEDVQGAER
jgi:hypothetical protein